MNTKIYQWITGVLLLAVGGMLVYQTWFKPDTPFEIDKKVIDEAIARIEEENRQHWLDMNAQLNTIQDSLRRQAVYLGTINSTSSKGLEGIKQTLKEIQIANQNLQNLTADERDALLRKLLVEYEQRRKDLPVQ